MGTLRTAALIVSALSAVALPADPPPKSGRIERTAEFVARVDASIARGVQWLKSAKTDEVASIATAALAYRAMRACGVPADDAAATKTWRQVRRVAKDDRPSTEAAATVLLAIESRGEPLSSPPGRREVKVTSPEDLEWAHGIAEWLIRGQAEDGTWNAVGGELRPELVGMDHSSAAYALLGLHAAARCGINVDASVWKKALTPILAAQDESGPEVQRGPGGTPRDADAKGASAVDHARGWNYRVFTGPALRNGPGSAAMTASGVSSVVICRSELLAKSALPWKLDVASERSIRDGIAWLGRPPRGAAGFCEYRADSADRLHSYAAVERAGRLAGVEWMAELDWYGAGARRILDAQCEDGGWLGEPVAKLPKPISSLDRGAAIEATSNALIFLAKATSPVRRGGVTEFGTDTEIDFVAAGNLTGAGLGEFLDLVLARWRRAVDLDVKRLLFEGATAAGPRIVEPLLVRMDTGDEDERTPAHALLRHATGLDFGYRAQGSSTKREDAVDEWQAWWMRTKDRLAYDAAAKRLVER